MGPTSPNPHFILAPATLEDMPLLGPICIPTFHQYPLLTKIFPWTPSVRKWCSASNRRDFLEDAHAHFIKVVDTSVDGDSNTAEGKSQGKIVAYAQWYGPKYDAVAAEKKEGGDQEVPWPTEEGDQELLALFFGGAHERHVKIMGHRPHYFLHIICTLPEYQGRGIGSLLVKWGCDQADREGVEAYLVAAMVRPPKEVAEGV